MRVNGFYGYDNTTFGRLNMARKGAQYVMRQLETHINPANSDKIYAVYHGVIPKAEKTVTLPPVVQAMRRYLAGDIKSSQV